MEIKEVQRTVISKPVAWRPAFSDVKSFSELLAGHVHASVPAALSKTPISAIRPKTVRFKPVDVSGSAASYQTSKVPESNAVYKPIAKLASKTTASLLANLGQVSNDTRPGPDITKVGAHIQPLTEVKNHVDLTSDCNPNFLQNTEIKRVSEDEKKSLLPLENRDRPAYNGHSWRKYGQKPIKGSEYSRSYYKCTYPNCPVKKKVETTIDGQIAERVYKGDHNHLKPQRVMYGNAVRLEGHSHNDIESSSKSAFPLAAPAPPTVDPLTATKGNASVSTSNNSFGPIGECEEVRDAEDREHKRKRRKGENQPCKAGGQGDASSESRVIVQNNNDSEMTGDGFRWRKYGQKVVKGNSYPRSYYRCTNSKCSAKKYVERTSEGADAFIITYEGRHNHEMPVKGTISEALRTSYKNKSGNNVAC